VRQTQILEHFHSCGQLMQAGNSVALISRGISLGM